MGNRTIRTFSSFLAVIIYVNIENIFFNLQKSCALGCVGGCRTFGALEVRAVRNTDGDRRHVTEAVVEPLRGLWGGGATDNGTAHPRSQAHVDLCKHGMCLLLD